ncbi:TM0106 family RecB-like putative nuclease [Geodermatophilus ruber]|uniref:RecB family nuclease, putative, TM0106 family n=1 Tax=Geodermatophilus ruber TaxID=504800 RepID=A0A1I4C1J4_9ACTN|nr:TM0106 family RecB-like putative nuclease [Geodermatophilus ruber]SFK74199.1 RecB family nuclease, putative, TM0106 family [Geodermatophilus ruber]
MTGTLRPILLGGYAAKRCPRATHNEYDLTVPRVEWQPDPAVQEQLDEGRAFEDDVVEALLSAAPDAIDLRPLEDDKWTHIAETMRHLASGTGLIVGGRLPDDDARGRTGKPDLLIWAEDRPDGRPGYHVGDIKHHLTLHRSPNDSVEVSLASVPSRAQAVVRAGVALRVGDREDDCLQLAHYWRLLEAAGHAAVEPWGAVLGTDGAKGYVPDPLVLSWYDLNEPLFTTFSRTAGKRRRSSLERYDHEHAFRFDVADLARRRTGEPGDPVPLVVPIGHEECGDCRWASVCVDTLTDDDLSRELGGVLSVREYLTLRAQNVVTVSDLAAAELDDVLTEDYHQEVAHRQNRAARLKKARLHAELAEAGLDIRRRADAPSVPTADVEYDIDCEWSPSPERVYLWGVLRTDGEESTYVPFLDLSVDDVQAEYDLAERFLRWLDDAIQADGAAGRSVAVFHYHHPERSQLRRITSTSGRELPEMCAEAAPEAWIDLCKIVEKSLDSRIGHGLKAIAMQGAGFEWRDDDPGGLQSQTWYEQALAGDALAEERLLAYNRDDVQATAEVRRWLRTPSSLSPKKRSS